MLSPKAKKIAKSGLAEATTGIAKLEKQKLKKGSTEASLLDALRRQKKFFKKVLGS